MSVRCGEIVHNYRRRHPEEYPIVCKPCDRRFKLPPALADHNKDKEKWHDEMEKIRSAEIFDMPKKDFQRYLKRNIEPDAEYSRDCRRVVDRLCRFMRDNFPDSMKPQEINKGGSLGKGTSVKGKSDVDLIFFLPEKQYFNIEQLKRDLSSHILPAMERYLGDNKDCKILKTTPWFIKLELRCHHGHNHTVDILPTVNILKSHTKSEVYKMMKTADKDTREYYSAALAPFQKDFVSRVPPKVKTLIQAVKYWRKMCFRDSYPGEGRYLPGSYPLELITINEWQKAGAPENFDLQKGLYNVFRRLSKPSRIRKVWTDNYERKDAKSSTGSNCYLVDPANPFNNVMDSSNAWHEVGKVARATLRSPLFDDLTGITDWK